MIECWEIMSLIRRILSAGVLESWMCLRWISGTRQDIGLVMISGKCQQHDFSTVGTKKFRETPLAASFGQGNLDVFAVEQGDGLVWHTSWDSSAGSESADGTELGDSESNGRLLDQGGFKSDRVFQCKGTDIRGASCEY